MSSQLKQLSKKEAKYDSRISVFEPLELGSANGSGLLKSYYTNMKKACALCLFTTEGDNRPDAHLLVKAISNVLGLEGM